MEVIFRAKDGKEFSDEQDCKDYEWLLNHKLFKKIKFADGLGREFSYSEVFDDSVRANMEWVLVPADAIESLKEFAKYTDYPYFYDITCAGMWHFNSNTDKFEEDQS